MRDYVDRLSATLIEQYKLYIETLTVDLWSDHGLVEFQVGFSLRIDHKKRSFMVKIDASEAINDIERRTVIAAIFAEIEDKIDEAIAENLIEMN